MGDQTYWWAIVSNRTELFGPMSYDWGVTSCVLNTFNTVTMTPRRRKRAGAIIYLSGTPYEGQVVLPKIHHFVRTTFSVGSLLSDVAVFPTAIAYMISSAFAKVGLTQKWQKTALQNIGNPPSTTMSVTSGSGYTAATTVPHWISKRSSNRCLRTSALHLNTQTNTYLRIFNLILQSHHMCGYRASIKHFSPPPRLPSDSPSSSFHFAPPLAFSAKY